MELFSKTSLAVGSTDDVPGSEKTQSKGDELRQDKRKRKMLDGGLDLEIGRINQ